MSKRGSRSFALILLCAATLIGQQRGVTDPGVVTTHQRITPAGVQSIFQDRVYGAVFGSDPTQLWVLTGNEVVELDWQRNRSVQRAGFKGSAGLQGIQFDGKRPWIALAEDPPKRELPKPFWRFRTFGTEVKLFSFEDGKLRPAASALGTELNGSLAVSGSTAAVPLTFDNKLAMVRIPDGKLISKIGTGIAPFAAVLTRDASTAWVSNWGGRRPKAGERTAPTGYKPGSDQVVVDERGIAATGSVQKIDVRNGTVTNSISTGLHPTAMALDETRQRLYVTNSNQDSITVIDTATALVSSVWNIDFGGQRLAGISPTALTISPEGDTLYVACGGINAIAVFDAKAGKLSGFIPTSWYPAAVSLSPDGRFLAVGALLGVGSGTRGGDNKRYVHQYRGSVAVLPVPDTAQLAAYTIAVGENNRVPLFTSGTLPNRSAAPVPLPVRPGEPSLIDHVVFIIKENRTYDQLFGDLPEGNGDPSLLMFGEDVAPNHRRLARQFVLFDNFYATGGNSSDGHQWLTQANETAYVMWPGYTGRSYPADGSDPIAYSNSGFLWDLALKNQKSVRMFGEFAGHMEETEEQRVELLQQWKQGRDWTRQWNITAPLAPLNNILARNYPSATSNIPDQIRADIFLADLERWKKEERMPNLVYLWLPSDHTLGAYPGTSSPKAMVADNDLALGRVVDALSHSRFWPKMAVFVVEDDAQGGVDHVDGHRTVALVASPYARRGHVDSTFYSQQSMLKSIELMLGLPALTLFDLIATDMRAAFKTTSDLAPYDAVKPSQSLYETNPPLKAVRGEARRAALDSQRMRFDIPDAAPTDRLNRIVWGLVRGWNTPYPGRRDAVFSPLSVDVDDDKR
ncbi:MAG: bifunctional YncE family protein/alkaline phosphatase family protein [Bryobacteraceae bacterium]|nr:bifunctional YncE family protein/alkaline phosphatase family protein [Bryobacteraceae bacterium]